MSQNETILARAPGTRHNILLIVEDGAEARIIACALTDSIYADFEVEWVSSVAAAARRLARGGMVDWSQEKPFSAIIVSSGRLVRHSSEQFERLFDCASGIPILLVSEPGDEALAGATMQWGAQDYLKREHLESYLLPKALATMIQRAELSRRASQRNATRSRRVRSIASATRSLALILQVPSPFLTQPQSD